MPGGPPPDCQGNANPNTGEVVACKCPGEDDGCETCPSDDDTNSCSPSADGSCDCGDDAPIGPTSMSDNPPSNGTCPIQFNSNGSPSSNTGPTSTPPSPGTIPPVNQADDEGCQEADCPQGTTAVYKNSPPTVLDRVNRIANRGNKSIQQLIQGLSNIGGSGGCTPSIRVNLANSNILAKIGPPAAGPYDPQISLYFNSLLAETPTLYGSWNLSLSRNISTTDNPSSVVLTEPTGRGYTYSGVSGATGTYQTPYGAANALAKTVAGWTETQPNGFAFLYDTDGLLINMQTATGATWTLSYLPIGSFDALSTVQDPTTDSRRSSTTHTVTSTPSSIPVGVPQSSRLNAFTTELISITSPELCTTTFQYDESQNLTSSTSPSSDP